MKKEPISIKDAILNVATILAMTFNIGFILGFSVLFGAIVAARMFL